MLGNRGLVFYLKNQQESCYFMASSELSNLQNRRNSRLSFLSVLTGGSGKKPESGQKVLTGVPCKKIANRSFQ